MKTVGYVLLLSTCFAAGAFAAGACPTEITSRFPPAQARVLCGEAAPSYGGTRLEHSSAEKGGRCATPAGSCPLTIAGPQGAPCECFLESGRRSGFIQK